MFKPTWMVLALALGAGTLSGCGPIIGAGAVIAADKVLENENGDDGLF